MQEVLLGVIVFLFVAYVTREFLRRFNPKLPPGPWGLPIFGYSLFLTDNPHEDYWKLGKKYGPVFGFHFGSRYTVVLGDYASIKEAYNKEEFLDKPGSIQNLFEEPNILAMNGEQWKEARRFVLSTFRTLGMGKNRHEERILEEISIDLEELEKLDPDKEINTQQFFYRTFVNNIFSIVNGLKIGDSENTLSMTKRFNEVFFSEGYISFVKFHFPLMRLYYNILQLFGVKKMRTDEMDNYLRHNIALHKKRFDSNNKDDLFDYFIDEMMNKKHEKDSSTFTEPGMIGNAKLAVLGGTETTQATLDFCLLCLAEYPDVQEQLYKEIVDLLGKEKPPAWADKDSLIYTSAFIMEVQRFKTVAPASDPHCASRSGTVAGYHIPAGAVLLANVYAVHMDPKLWGDPDNFRPNRFISSDNKLLTPEYWMPFLIGKRMCPGEKLASMQLFLLVTSIVQKFKVLPPKSGLSLEGKTGLMYCPVKPVVSIQRRP